jgi:mannose-6-phosphate isomerase-like protein (cupin superfamily)
MQLSVQLQEAEVKRATYTSGRLILPRAPRISFDKAVLERHEAVAITALDAMWHDVGIWTEVAELYPVDAGGNRQGGRVHLSSSHDSFVLSPHRLTVGIGLTDLVVVDTLDALLIANRNELGLLGKVVEAMTAAHYPEVAADAEQINTKWTEMGDSEISIRPPHRDHSRYWIVLQGTVRLTIRGESSTYAMNESFHVPPGIFHTIGNVDSTPISLIEIHVVAKVSSRIT